MMSGGAQAKGAVSIVNAIAGGRGATVAVDLPTSARVSVEEKAGPWRASENGKKPGSRLASESARRAIEMLGMDPRRYSGSVDTISSAPVGVGLKTSSSASVAVVLAVCDAFGMETPPASEILNCSAGASLASGVSITGAMDDAASCLLGGANFADNSARKLLARATLGSRLPVVVWVPLERSRRRSVDAAFVRRFSDVADSIFRIGIDGAKWKAMILNGLLYSSIYGYDPHPALEALEAGSLGSGLSGTGPAVAAVFEGEEEADSLALAWAEGGAGVIRTRTTDGGATTGA